MHPIQEPHSQGNWNQYLLVLDKSFDCFKIPMKDPIDHHQTLPLVPEINNSHAVFVDTCRRFRRILGNRQSVTAFNLSGSGSIPSAHTTLPRNFTFN